MDFEIQNAYEIRRRTNEQKTFKKSRENKYYIYQYIKRINKSKSTIGPFLEKGKIDIFLDFQFILALHEPILMKLVNKLNIF